MPYCVSYQVKYRQKRITGGDEFDLSQCCTKIRAAIHKRKKKKKTQSNNDERWGSAEEAEEAEEE